MNEQNLKDFDSAPRALVSGWKGRAIIACRGNQTFTGCILLAALGRAASNPPRIVSAGIIDKHGDVYAFFQSKNHDMAKLRKLCSLTEYIDRFRFLADHLKLNDDERAALFREVKTWIGEDYRAKKDWDYARQQHA